VRPIRPRARRRPALLRLTITLQASTIAPHEPMPPLRTPATEPDAVRRRQRTGRRSVAGAAVRDRTQRSGSQVGAGQGTDAQTKKIMSKATEDKHQADDLLHCPFCGSDDLIRFRLHDTERIECQNCWGAGPTHEVTQKWNTRSQSADDSRPASCSHCEGYRQKAIEEATRSGNLLSENRRLRKAFHDAIRRPMGIVPASGDEFYDANAEVRPPETKP
jgi:transcription elongation factor Elf1